MSSFNNRSYTVFGSAQFDDMEGFGFSSFNKSDDGNYRISNKGDSTLCEDCDDNLAKPQYVLDYETANSMTFADWPHLSHEEALIIVNLPDWVGV